MMFGRLVFVLLLCFLNSLTAYAEGESAPTFSLRDINGKQVSLEDYKGSVVLINFWATWCGPCQTEMPHLEKIYTEHKDKGFVVLAVSADDARNASKVKPLIKRNGYTFPVLLDKDSSVVNQYNPESVLPYNVLINKEGNVIWRKVSYAPGEEVEIREKVEEAIGFKKKDDK
jgi:peroxiredoxin